MVAAGRSCSEKAAAIAGEGSRISSSMAASAAYHRNAMASIISKSCTMGMTHRSGNIMWQRKPAESEISGASNWRLAGSWQTSAISSSYHHGAGSVAISIAEKESGRRRRHSQYHGSIGSITKALALSAAAAASGSSSASSKGISAAAACYQQHQAYRQRKSGSGTAASVASAVCM